MQFCRVSTLKTRVRHGLEPAIKEDRSRLWKLAEELSIPTKELNELAKEVVGREFGTVTRLTAGENMKFRRWLSANRVVLGERYRKMLWTQRST